MPPASRLPPPPGLPPPLPPKVPPAPLELISLAELPPELDAKLKLFFDKMDGDKNGEVSKAEAVAFWGKNFAKVNAQSMFNEVDEDGNESISWEEFRKFWQNVVGSGYPQEDVEEEVDMMLEGGSWVDFNDGRTT